MRGRRAVLSMPLLFVSAALLSSTIESRADSQPGTVDQQEYESSLPKDPCAGTTPPDLCVSAAGGSETAEAYVHIDLSRIPTGAQITSITLSLTPDAANSAGNLNASSATLQTCPLATALGSSVSSSSHPAADCQAASAPGRLQPDGTWSFDLTPLVRVWADGVNNGLAVVPALSTLPAPASPPAQPPVSGAPSAVPLPTQNWSVAVLTTKTSAVVDYQPSAPAATPAASASAAPALSVAPARTPPRPPLPRLPEAVGPAVVPAAPSLPSVPPTASAAPPVQAPQSIVALPPTTETVVVIRHLWFLAALAMIALAGGLLVGAARTQLRGGRISPGAVAAALARGRAQTATAVGLLLIGAAVAAGAAGQPVTVTVSASVQAPANGAEANATP